MEGFDEFEKKYGEVYVSVDIDSNTSWKLTNIRYSSFIQVVQDTDEIYLAAFVLSGFTGPDIGGWVYSSLHDEIFNFPANWVMV